MTFRLTVLTVIFTLAYSTLLFHLYDVQLTRNKYYTARLEAQTIAALPKDERGIIYFTDKNGTPLPVVTNKYIPLIFAVPKDIADALGSAALLAPILGDSADALAKKFSKPNSLYELLKRKADPEVAEQISDLKIKGIYVQDVPERFYPFGALAAQVLGFVGPNDGDAGESGHYGIEELRNGILSGAARAAAEGRSFSSGENITLTLDMVIQKEAERILKNAVETHGATSGSVIVEEPKTGKILAMGGYPSFDPNAYSESPVANFLNPNIEQRYEPGSVFKVLTMAAGIDSGKITPETTYVDTGKLIINGRTRSNYYVKANDG